MDLRALFRMVTAVLFAPFQAVSKTFTAKHISRSNYGNAGRGGGWASRNPSANGCGSTRTAVYNNGFSGPRRRPGFGSEGPVQKIEERLEWTTIRIMQLTLLQSRAVSLKYSSLR